MMRDLGLYGQLDSNLSNPLGEGVVAEITDLPTSRVSTDMFRVNGAMNSIGIGNAAFDMKSFSQGGGGTIMGNNGQNSGYFSFFGGNPTNLTIGDGVNLMIQDTWYEGNDSNYINCPSGQSANVTVESSMLSMGGWHSDASTASNLTTLNVNGCTTKMALISDNIGRTVCGAADSFYAGFPGGCLAPNPNMMLSASDTAATQVLFLGDQTNNSTYADINGDTSNAVIPTNFIGPVDQEYFLADPQTHAQYAALLGTFSQKLLDGSGNVDWLQLPAINSGLIQKNFISSMIGQALDPRLIAPPPLVTPVTDMQSTDILIERVNIVETNMDLQFILPGAASQ